MAPRKSHRVVFQVYPAPPFTSYAAAKRAIDWVCDEASGMQGALSGDECDQNREEIEHVRKGLKQLALVIKKERRAKKTRGRR